jgi:hypothetical protein
MHFATTASYTAQGIALAKPLVSGTTEDRVIRNAILNAELAKPPVRQIDLHLRTQLAL